jgi:hypothetical protein
VYPGTYARNLDGAHVEMGAFGALLAAKQPRLAAHLSALGCEPSLLATDWFLCLFATSLPPEGAARVWDALLAEAALARQRRGRSSTGGGGGGVAGSSKVLHRVGLALLAGAAPALMATDNPGAAVVP